MVFVSPLFRTLQTAEGLIKQSSHSLMKLCGRDAKIKALVLPELTEIVSKVCDFSDSIEGKITRFQSFDFTHFLRWEAEQRGNNGKRSFWQDSFILNPNYR